MRFPDLLYQPSDFEAAKSAILPQRVMQTANESVAAATITDLFGPIPREFAFVLTHAHISSSAGGVQNVTELFIQTETTLPAVLLLSLLVHQFPSTPTNVQNAAAGWQGELIMMPGEVLGFEARFSAGVAANQMRSSLHGYLIPRSNLQFSQLAQIS